MQTRLRALLEPAIIKTVFGFSLFHQSDVFLTQFTFLTEQMIPPMASENLVQETEGEFRNGKTVFVKGVRMPYMFAYLTGFKDFIENFQTRQDDVFIVGFPRSGESKTK